MIEKMHPYIIITEIALYKKNGRGVERVHLIKKKWYKIKSSYYPEYKKRYVNRAKKEFGDDVMINIRYKQKMSRKEYRNELKKNNKFCEK